jgi:hypothetical protein
MPDSSKGRVQVGPLGWKLRKRLTTLPWKTIYGKELHDRYQLREGWVLVLKEMKVLRGW